MKPQETVGDVGTDLARNLALAAHAIAQAAAALQAAAGQQATPGPPPLSRSLTLGEAVRAVIEAKARAGRSRSYLRLLRARLGALQDALGDREISAVSAFDLEAWLSASGWAAKTRLGALRDAGMVFAWATRRGFCRENPAAAIDAPRPVAPPPGIHSPAETAAVLEYARKTDADACRCLAVRYFAGLRTSEAVALAEGEITGGWIRVEAHKAKTRRARLVRVRPNLAAWLATGGRLPLRNPNTRLAAVTAGAGVPWPRNAPRHSWCSYALAETGSPSRVALEAGHSEAVLFACYRALVTPESAADYFGVEP